METQITQNHNGHKPRHSTNSPQSSKATRTESLNNYNLSPDTAASVKPRSASVREVTPDGKSIKKLETQSSSMAVTVSPPKAEGMMLEVMTTKPRSLSAKLESPEGYKGRISVGNKTPPVKKSDIFSLNEPWVLANFTEEQLEKIKQFRNGPAAEFITPADTDLQIYRWLTARKMDSAEASKMFIESKKWRKNEKMDSISEWIQNIKPYKFLSEYWPNSILPGNNSPKIRTHDGYLVVYEKLAEVHPDILDIVSLDDMVKFHLYIQELCTKELINISEEKNDAYAGIVFVYDLSDLSMNHLSRANYNMFQVFNSHDANNYPETLRRVYIINAPQIFTIGWKVAKKFLDPVTIKKIVILGNDYKQELLNAIPAESLPKAYGGTLDFLPSGGGSIKGIKKFT